MIGNMGKKKIIWTFLDDDTQQAFYDLLGRLSPEGQLVIENKILAKIDEKGKPIVGIIEVKLEKEKIFLIGTFGECSFPDSLLKK